MPDSAPCTAKAAHSSNFGVSRMMGLETAAELLGGKPKLADALGIQPRSLRHKLTADRSISNGDLLLAATSLESLAGRAAEHARKLRAITEHE